MCGLGFLGGTRFFVIQKYNTNRKIVKQDEIFSKRNHVHSGTICQTDQTKQYNATNKTRCVVVGSKVF